MSLLSEIAFNANARVNRHESNVSINQILFEIQGDTQGRPGGLMATYKGILKTLQVDQTGIDDLCLPCKRKGVKYLTI